MATGTAVEGRAQPNLPFQIRVATILTLCFLAEHNLPFLLCDHMSELYRVMFPDSAIAQVGFICLFI